MPEIESGPGAAKPFVRRAAVAYPERRYGLFSRLRSYFFIDPLVFFYTFVMGLASVPLGFFDRDGALLHGCARLWSKLIMGTIFCPIKISGLGKIDHSKANVIAFNHASALDIPVLYAHLPFQFRIVFKSELLGYPIVGWHLKRSGQVCINQQNPSRSIASIRSALKSLKAGTPLVIFPEGGRTPHGEILPFLPGAFFLAIKAQVDVVPVALIGTYELLPMNTYHVKCRPLEMRVGEPIPTTGLTLRDLEALSEKVENALKALYYESTGLTSNTARFSNPNEVQTESNQPL